MRKITRGGTKVDVSSLLKTSDKSGRTLRPVQEKVFREVCDAWDKFELITIVAPTSTGKSLISRAIQIQTDAVIITPNNVLVKQYAAEYREMNYFYGAAHYPSKNTYYNHREAACYPDSHTITNPIAWLVAKRTPGFEHPNVVIIDEGHAINGLLLEQATVSFKIESQPFFEKKLASYHNFIEFVRGELANLRVEIEDMPASKYKTREQSERREDKLLYLLAALKEEPENIAIYFSEKLNKRGQASYYVNAKPVRIPHTTLKKFFGDAKIVLMSATMFPSDILELAGGRKYYTCEVESPIPLDRRPILYAPMDGSMKYDQIDYQQIAQELDKVLEETQLRPALIHVSYRDAIQISRHMKTPHITHDKDKKLAALNEFLRDGGVLLGSGMSEGLDLKDDLCRLNIIVKLLFPNLGDPFVQKRRALADGEWWYKLSTLKTLIQQAGRATRSPKDYSMTLILDKRFPFLLSSLKEEVPDFFRKAIQWHKQDLKVKSQAMRRNFGEPGLEQVK